ncbi:prepilin-type N-terminal cleavage/methylation domain-containing protein [Candidatus Woesebacteria bacterium]|nr:prepilin-type N-terminal cleavage/methylation domain-containing protein [Candidatus Woesebacteria bacterium]
MQKTSLKISGFTLIELLVVIAITGVLASLLLANFAGIRDRADDAAKKSDLKQLQSALRLYYNDNNQYPAAVGLCKNLPISGYLSKIASFPDTCKYDRYGEAINTLDTYKVCVPLANTSDSEAALSATSCGGAIAGVTNPYCVCSN